MAKNSACTASSHALLVRRTTAKTTMVISAPNRGPLGIDHHQVLLFGWCLVGYSPLARGGGRPATARLGAAGRGK